MPHISDPRHSRYEFSTSDMVEVVVLMYFGFDFLSISKSPVDSRRSVFTFDRCAELDAVLERLAAGQLLVEPVKFLNTYRVFKQKMKYQDKIVG